MNWWWWWWPILLTFHLLVGCLVIWLLLDCIQHTWSFIKRLEKWGWHFACHCFVPRSHCTVLGSAPPKLEIFSPFFLFLFAWEKLLSISDVLLGTLRCFAVPEFVILWWLYHILLKRVQVLQNNGIPQTLGHHVFGSYFATYEPKPKNIKT